MVGPERVGRSTSHVAGLGSQQALAHRAGAWWTRSRCTVDHVYAALARAAHSALSACKGKRGREHRASPFDKCLTLFCKGLVGDEVTGPSRAPTSSPASPHSAKAAERVKAGAWASARPAMAVAVDDSATAV
jgi:hypothetical protein